MKHFLELDAMDYPFLELTAQLQFLCTPAEYSRLIQAKHYSTTSEFLSVLPTYTFAYCPLCNLQYTEAANTYGLSGWGYIGLGQTLFAADTKRRAAEKRKHCDHFLGIRTFINLHGSRAKEMDTFHCNEGEVPLIEAHFFINGLKSYVVLHAFPICRTENNTFVPSYTVFAMTYFCEDPDGIVRHTYASQTTHFKIDPEYWPTLVQNPEFADQEQFDLANWALLGKLGWLDFTQTALPLRLGQGEELPAIYSNIEGRHSSYNFVNK